MLNIYDIWYYDPSSPSGIRWKIEVRAGNNHNIIRAKPGDIAGSKNTRGYYHVKYKEFYLKCHRLVILLNGLQLSDKEVVDHIDGNLDNNHLDNLRVTLQSVNSRNRVKSTLNTSGVTGVNLHGKYWKAQYYENGTPKCKYFSITKLGDKAFELAVEFRKNMIERLNQQNYQYSERHGNEPK